MQQGEKKPLRIFCKAVQNLNLALRGGDLSVEPADSTDRTQHWFQYFDTFNLIDDEGRKPFALVNRITGQAIAYRQDEQQVASYSSEAGVDVSMLLTMGEKGTAEAGDGFAEVRALKNISAKLAAGYSNVSQRNVVGWYYAGNADPHGAVWKFEPIPDQPSINTTAAV